jgi:hypothetical protein
MIPRSPFQQYVNDVSPDLRKIIENHCHLIRQAMCRILKEQDIDVGKPERSVLRRISTSIIFADMSIEELRPKYMRGYGKLSDEATDTMNAIATELQEFLNKMKASLPE